MPIYEANTINLTGVTSERATNVIENSQRKRVDPIEKARAMKKMLDDGASFESICLLFTGPDNKPLKRRMVQNYLRLLDLHPSVQDAVRDGLIKVTQAQCLLGLSDAEQIKTLQGIREALGLGVSNKENAVEQVIAKTKRDKRLDRDGQPMYDLPRAAPEMRRQFKLLTQVENWDCLPKTTKLTNEGYAAVVELFRDILTWSEGGLTPKSYKPEDMTLALKSRVLALFGGLSAPLAAPVKK